jgi:hypothetical protein
MLGNACEPLALLSTELGAQRLPSCYAPIWARASALACAARRTRRGDSRARLRRPRRGSRRSSRAVSDPLRASASGDVSPRSRGASPGRCARWPRASEPPRCAIRAEVHDPPAGKRIIREDAFSLRRPAVRARDRRDPSGAPSATATGVRPRARRGGSADASLAGKRRPGSPSSRRPFLPRGQPAGAARLAGLSSSAPPDTDG